MPPSTRRRVQQAELHTPHPEDDTDSETDLGVDRREHQSHLQQEEDLEGELLEVEGDEDLEDEEALASPGGPQAPLLNLDPPPSYLREISTLASWTVSSSKPGCSVPQLRHPSTNLFWQSDGPQPHYLNIHFFKLVRIVGLRLYLDFEQDESYTPTRIIFLAGSGMNDLQEWGEMRLESPRGWVWADFSGVGDVESDSDDSDNENENNGDVDQRMIDVEPRTLALQDASSDSENNNPHQRRYVQDDNNPAPTPQQQQQQQLQTPQNLQHHMYTTPTDLRHATPQQHNLTTPSFPPPQSLPRPTPRLPFAALSHNNTTIAPRPQSRQRRPRMPVLRAHLVQIKILENHQNGKDTHLRGLQIFARNDDKEAAREPVMRVTTAGMKGGAGGKSAELVRMGKRGERKVERLELGGFEEESLR